MAHVQRPARGRRRECRSEKTGRARPGERGLTVEGVGALLLPYLRPTCPRGRRATAGPGRRQREGGRGARSWAPSSQTAAALLTRVQAVGRRRTRRTRASPSTAAPAATATQTTWRRSPTSGSATAPTAIRSVPGSSVGGGRWPGLDRPGDAVVEDRGQRLDRLHHAPAGAVVARVAPVARGGGLEAVLQPGGARRRVALGDQGRDRADVGGGEARGRALLAEVAVAPGAPRREDVAAGGDEVDVRAVDRVVGDPVVGAGRRRPRRPAGRPRGSAGRRRRPRRCGGCPPRRR